MGVQQSAGPVSVHCEGVEGADFPSVSLVTGWGWVGGGGLPLMGALACTFTRWGRGGGLVSLSHNSTVTKHSTNHHNLVTCTKRKRERKERELSQALSPGQDI